MKHKILFAVDGGKNSLKTALYAARACAGSEQSVVRIVVFHVLPRLPPHVEGSRAADTDARAKLFKRKAFEKAERMLGQIKARVVAAGVTEERVTTEATEEEGDVVAQIMEAAARHRCDTIAVGRHHKSVMEKLLTDSVGAQLLRKKAGYTIWIVK